MSWMLLSPVQLRLGKVSRLFVFAVFTLVISSPTAAQTDDESPRTARRGRGSMLYQIHCQTCHGEKGHGDGGTAEFLTKKVPDLTQLSGRNGGVFPVERVIRVIDGRDDIPVHGRREMPIWGLSLQDSSLDTNNEDEVQSRINALAGFLRSIQTP